MTLVFRITVDDDQAHAIVRMLKPFAQPAHGAKRLSNNTVRHTLAPRLRARCEEQMATWTAQVSR